MIHLFDPYYGLSLQYFVDYQSKKPRVVGHIDQLFIYPLKSGEGIEIPSAYAAEQSRI